ncbi:MAG TPA: hypothetical protein VMT82_04170 [candidate division Zixibacteria bacterium]|nr:hypothetical protein [candidate division Zixibacteria bacterium]
MNKPLFAFALGAAVLMTPVLVVAQAGSQQAAPAAVDPTIRKAREQLDKMIKAMGGDAFLNYNTVTQLGRTYSFYQGQPREMSIQYARMWQWPDKDRFQLAVADEYVLGAIIGIDTTHKSKNGTVSYIHTGDKGFEVSYKGTAEEDPKSLQDFIRRRAHSPEVVLREWLKDPATIVLPAGDAIVDQRMANQVTIINSKNDSVTLAIDANSNLLVSRSFTFRDEFGYKVTDTEMYSNYRNVDGIMSPMSIVRYHDDQMVSQRFVSEAHYNVNLAPTTFDAQVTYDTKTKKK